MITEPRIALQDEIKMTREKFHRLLATIPHVALQLPSRDPAWTNGEVLYRISISPLVIKSVLKRNFGSWSRFLLPKLVTGPLTQKSNELFIKTVARNLTPSTYAQEYEDNTALVLEMLQELSVDDLATTLTVTVDDPLLSGQVTVEQLFHYVRNYFGFHGKQIDLGR
jgi:hypothetical protein